MDGARFDAAAKLFAGRRVSRRHARTRGGDGLAVAGLAATDPTAAAAQIATPGTEMPDAAHGPAMLFVQSFQSGSIAPKEGVEGRYTVTLEHGLGQTIYFSDRPDRVVGTNPTEDFLKGLGFPADNPPNAALVVDNAAGETDVAVVELFDPVYDPAGPTVTYEVAVLADWEASTDLGFTAATADLAALAPSFGAAHLFIDDCPDGKITCKGYGFTGYIPISSGDGYGDGFCYSWAAAGCYPCQPWYDQGDGTDLGRMHDYWVDQCKAWFPGCGEDCHLGTWCSKGFSFDCEEV